jgi:plasmid stabilization system protein ParE
MNLYAFHPEARVDLDEIWEFIRADNLDAADRVGAEILSATRALAPFPHQGHKRLTLRPALCASLRKLSDCLCARRKAVVGYSCYAWQAQPSRHGGDIAGQGVGSPSEREERDRRAAI